MFITVVVVGNVFRGVCQSFCSWVGRVSLVPSPFQVVGYPGGRVFGEAGSPAVVGYPGRGYPGDIVSGL